MRGTLEMKLVVAKRLGRRGEGLGNEMLAWAKGWIASQELDAHLVGPSWGINARHYYRNFRSCRLDFMLEDLLAHLPHYSFSEEDFRATGEIDFGTAIRAWATKIGLVSKKNYIVIVEGMWGGYPSIYRSRKFLLANLLQSRDALKNLQGLESGLDRSKLTIAVHMRTAANEFVPVRQDENCRGRFNILIPGEWYLWVCEALRTHFGDRIQFRLFTDRGGKDYDEAVRRFNPGQIRQAGLTECSDLLAMTFADLRICSVSSYSLMANFLSGGPYVWYEPQLTVRNCTYSLWGEEPQQLLEGSRTSSAIHYVLDEEQGHGADHGPTFGYLGSTMKVGDSIPSTLVQQLEQKLAYQDPRTNLIEYGCIPI